MAYINRFSVASQGRQRSQSEAIGGELISLDFDGEKFVQINSVGSSGRQEAGKQSQNIRLDEQAFRQLVDFGRKHFGLDV